MSAYNIIPGGWFDPFELICSLRPRMGWFREPVNGKRIVHATDKVQDKWPELANMLDRLRQFGKDAYENGRASVEMIDPQAITPWEVDPGPYEALGQQFIKGPRFLMALRSNMGFAFHGPAEVINPNPGQLFMVDTRLPRCAINMGESPWIGLVIDAKPKASSVN
jgi:hypothetical protein